MMSPLNTPPLSIALFGPMAVLVEGEPLPPVRSRKVLYLLALLTLRQGRPVEREWLAGTLWPDADQSQAFANLRPVLSQLRAALGPEASRLLALSQRTLQLDLSNAEVDVLIFDAGIASKLSEARERATTVYKGPLLEGCSEDWVFQERDARKQSCLEALQWLGQEAVLRGDYAGATGLLRRAVQIDPISDSAHRELMDVLAKAGDRNAALELYRTFDERLRRELGTPPDNDTTTLYRRLRQEARAGGNSRNRGDSGDSGNSGDGVRPLHTITASGHAVSVVSGSLPHPLTELIGREDECLEVTSRLRRARLVTLTGPGGIGKTRLALAVASEVVHSYPDGVWLVALDALREGTQITGQVASVLAVKEEIGKPLLESLIAYLQTKRLLLVLDNCEQVLTASAEFARQLLSRCAGIRILATSRAALGMIGETAWGVPPLATPDPDRLPTGRATSVRVLAGYESVQLFVERAQALQRTFALTGDTVLPVAQICARLGGLPLAIELAAARVKMMHVSEIAHRLEDYLSLLTGGNRGAPPRQQTLRATLDWSYDLLGDSERVLLARLSGFAGGCDLAAIEYVCSGDGLGYEPVLEVLRGLVDKSLLSFEECPVEEGSRYYLLETVRQYAGERLEASGETERVWERHRDWYLAVAEEAGPYLEGPDQQVWMRLLGKEQGNLRAALDRNKGDGVGLQLVNSLWKFWDARGDYSEGRHYSQRALEHAGESGEPTLRAKVLNALGSLAFRQSDYAEALPNYEESLRLYRTLEDPVGVARVLGNLAAVIKGQGNYDRAQALYEESLGMHRALGNKVGMAQVLGNLGSGARLRYDPTSAKALYEESLKLYRELGNRRREQWALTCLSAVVMAQGDYPTAQALAEESLSLAQALEEKPVIIEALILLGELSNAQGNPALAQSFLEESAHLSRALGLQRYVIWSLLGLGEALRTQEEFVSAQEKYEEALSLSRRIGERQGEGSALLCLGCVAADRGDFAASQALYKESVAIFQSIHDTQGLARSLGGLAYVLFCQGKIADATRLSGASEALMGKSGIPFPLKEQKRGKYLADQARVRIGPDAFLEAWEAGHALTREQVVVYIAEL